MKNVVIYSRHLEYFTTLGYILSAFGNFVVIWYIIPRFGIPYQEKSGNPGVGTYFYVLKQPVTSWEMGRRLFLMFFVMRPVEKKKRKTFLRPSQ
jgi:hypothetical protein